MSSRNVGRETGEQINTVGHFVRDRVGNLGSKRCNWVGVCTSYGL